ncbi:MAG: protein kinase domain-containing protein [Isosphaeraceae bacterium]
MDAAPSLHPTDQTLSSFGLGKLNDRSFEAVNQHLEQCPDCRKRVAEMSADSFLGRVRDAKAANKSLFGQSMPSSVSNCTGAQALPPAETLPPDLAGNPDYEIKQELGRGGMGVVYLAHNRLMARDEVLKVMSRHLMERPGVVDRFLREIRAVATLRHPNIVTAYHATRVGESIMFAMEYVEGLDLARMVKAKGPMRIANACNFIYQAALGLQHAHEKGMIHRDIKPGNMMLAPKGDRATIKILDFGLAKVTREQKVDAALTSEGQALGTPDFIAPEQIVDAQSADIRADIYSLGGTLYYLLAGRPPFEAASLYDMYQAHISREADPLNLVRPEVPAELAALVAKMMAKDPARRFQTPAEVAEALAPFFKTGSQAFKTPPAEVSHSGQPAVGRPLAAAGASPTQPAMAATRLDAPSAKRAKRSVTEAPCESLVAVRGAEQSTNAKLELGSSRRPPWKTWPVALGGSLFALIAFGVIVITVKDKYGRETKITVPDDSTVVVEGPPKNIQIKAQLKGQQPPAGSDVRAPVTTAAGTESVATPRLPRSEKVGAPAFKPVFNGKDKTGWMESPMNRGEWTVVGGLLQGRGSGERGIAATLVTERKDFANFHLKAKFRFPEDGGAVIEVRYNYDAENTARSSYPVSLGVWPSNRDWANAPGKIRKLVGHPYGSGWAFQEKSASISVAPNQWHTLEIEAMGNEIANWIDGKKLAVFVDDDAVIASGAIALLCQYNSTVQFQEILIQELANDHKADEQPQESSGNSAK